METMPEVDLLSHKRTRYFQIKRTQPFFITFVQAIIAFKRVAKTMKLVFARRNMKKEKTQKNSMKQISRISTQKVVNALHGQPMITLTTEEMAEHRYLKSVQHKRADKELSSPTGTGPGFGFSSSPVPDGKPGSQPANAAMYGTKGSLPLNMAEKLRKTLNTAPSEAMLRSLEKSQAIAMSEHAGGVIANGISQLQMKNATIQDSETKHNREYVAGTVIYYGSSISVQARHGGYLSFNDSKNIKASAHKIMQHSRFIVTSADDASFGGAIKFGDAIMLQAGQHEVLGAQFQGGPDEGTTTRKIKPSLINFRQGNSGRAQNYGRWIICSKIEPEKRMGTAVCHFDKILLEQEWYFLGSSSPYDASMVKHSNFEEALDRSSKQSRKRANKLFQPREECTWKFVLVTLPTDKNEDERNREYMMQDAAVRILQSEERRWKTRELLMESMVNSLPMHLKLTEVAKNELSYKNNPHEEQEALYDMYEKIAQRDFKGSTHGIDKLVKIYGPDSNIVLHTLRARELRDAELGERPHRTEDDFEQGKTFKKTTEPFSLRLAKKEFWDHANKLMVDSRVYESMPTFMEKYYQKNADLKFKAGLVILRYLSRRKKRLKTKFTYSSEMRLMDQAEDKRLAKKKLEDEAAMVFQDEKAKMAADKVRNIASNASNMAAEEMKLQERLHTVNQDLIQNLTRNLSIRNAGRIGVDRRPSSAPMKSFSSRKTSLPAEIRGLPNSNRNEHIPRNPSAIAALQRLESDGKRATICTDVMSAQMAVMAQFREFGPSESAQVEAEKLQRLADEEEAEVERIEVERVEKNRLEAGLERQHSGGGSSISGGGMRGSASDGALHIGPSQHYNEPSFAPPRSTARPQTASALPGDDRGVAMPRIDEEGDTSSHVPAFSRPSPNQRPHTAHPGSTHAPHIEIPMSPPGVPAITGNSSGKPAVYSGGKPQAMGGGSPAVKGGGKSEGGVVENKRKIPTFFPASPFDLKKFIRPELNGHNYHTGWTPAKPVPAAETPKQLYTPEGPPSTHFSRRDFHQNVFAAPPSYSDTNGAKGSGQDRLSKSLDHVTQFRRLCTRNKDRLQRTSTKLHGLPSDVMKHQQKSVTINTSVKFLRAASKNPHLYDDVKVKIKR